MKISVKNYITASLLIAAIAIAACVATAQQSDPSATVNKNIAGKWLACDLSLKGSPAALEITSDGFVNTFLINNVPPFSDKVYTQWLFKKINDEQATAKSPAGDIMNLFLEKAGSEYYLQATMKEKSIFMYRPRGEESKTGFEGRWNMPSVPLIELKEDGTASFPVIPFPKYGDKGKYKIISGGRIALIIPNKETGVDTVIMVMKPTEDFNTLKFVLDENAYKEAGPVVNVPPKNELDPEIFSLIKGPSSDFFYSQPLIADNIKDIQDSALKADYYNCRLFLEDLQTIEESYRLETNDYAFTPEQLDKYVGGCVEESECKGKTKELADQSCVPGTLEITQTTTDGGDSYRIMARSKGDNPCNICVTSGGVFPQDFSACPNDELNCGE